MSKAEIESSCLINRLPTCFLTYGVINLKERDKFNNKIYNPYNYLPQMTQIFFLLQQTAFLIFCRDPCVSIFPALLADSKNPMQNQDRVPCHGGRVTFTLCPLYSLINILLFGVVIFYFNNHRTG